MSKEAKKIMTWKDRAWLDEHDDGYEEFYKKSGTYVIPVERFNEFIEEKRALEKRINKAIEYVEPLLTDHDDLKSYCILSYNKMVLLEMLRGDSNE